MNRSLTLAFLAAVAAAAPPPAVRTAPTGGTLARLVAADDYPYAALRNEEQGTVAFTLTVDAAGKVTACTVTASSGSGSLDTTTCRVMLERAHFTPARNRRGHAVPDTFSSKITWRIAAGPRRDPALDAAAQAWGDCLLAEAGRQAAGTDSAEAVADRAFAACLQPERGMLAAISATGLAGASPATQMPPAVRKLFRDTVLKRIAQLRSGAL